MAARLALPQVDGVVHYCVANIPGAVPVTSTAALPNATLPYVLRLAQDGADRALRSDPGLMQGLNVAAGCVTYEPLAHDHDIEHTAPASSYRSA